MRFLEEAVIKTIAVFGLKGERLEGMTGVWLDPGKSNERKYAPWGLRLLVG